MTLQQIDDVRDNIKMYEFCRHHNVIRLEDHFENKDNFYIVLELCSEMTLYKYISTVSDQLEESFVRDMGQKIG